MATGLRTVFNERRARAIHLGWPAPPGEPHVVTTHQAGQWLDYWAALERRAEREGWFQPSGKAALTPPGQRE